MWLCQSASEHFRTEIGCDSLSSPPGNVLQGFLFSLQLLWTHGMLWQKPLGALAVSAIAVPGLIVGIVRVQKVRMLGLIIGKEVLG
jgi:hypothetical protein